MANELKMAIVESIRQLLSLRWSQRRIAEELGIDRGAVARHARLLQADPKPAIPPTGSEEPKPAGFSRPPAPDSDSPAGDDGTAGDADSKPAIAPTGSRPPPEGRIAPAGRRSDCEAHAELITARIDAGLSAKRTKGSGVVSRISGHLGPPRPRSLRPAHGLGLILPVARVPAMEARTNGGRRRDHSRHC